MMAGEVLVFDLPPKKCRASPRTRPPRASVSQLPHGRLADCLPVVGWEEAKTNGDGFGLHYTGITYIVAQRCCAQLSSSIFNADLIVS